MPRSVRQLLAFILIGGILLFFLNSMQAGSSVQDIKYSDFVTAVNNGKVASVTIEGNHIYGTYVEPQPDVAASRATPKSGSALPSPQASKASDRSLFAPSPVATDASPAASGAAASPVAGDVASPVAGDVASPVAGDAAASPVAGDAAASPAASDVAASPVAGDVASPVAGNVAASPVASATAQGGELVGKLSPSPVASASSSKALANQRTYKEFKTYFRNDIATSPESLLIQHGVPTEIKEDSSIDWWMIILQILPLLLLIFFVITIMRQTGSNNQAFGFGRSKHKAVSEDKLKVTFDDVAGVEEAKEELAEVVDYLKFPHKYQALGARIPKGVLLLGSPGTGKTLLGRAVAGEAGVPFYYISGSDFVEMFVGVGASRVRDLFEQAKKSAPCIVFVDEIDAVGRQRGAGLGGGHDEREQTLNQLLVEMDGFDSGPTATAVIVLAATNRPDVLDPALLRPGRFDRQVVVDRPDIAGRLAILKVHSKGKPLASNVDLRDLAQRTPGFSGADLENLLNEAALLAARNERASIEMQDCTEAIDRVVMGPERKSRIISERDREVTAYHESGHALVARAIPEADPVRKITILPRGQALGVTSLVPETDRYNMTRSELLASISVFMGGRVAEQIVYDEISTGASNDIERATEMARDMVCRYGMSTSIGPLHFGRKQSQVFLGRDIVDSKNYSEDTSRAIDAEVHRIVSDCYQRAVDILTEHRADLDKLSDLLMTKELVEAAELDELFGAAARDLVEGKKPESTEDNGDDSISGDEDQEPVHDSDERESVSEFGL